MVVVTGKGGCDLCPVGVHLRVDGWIDIGRNVAIQPAAVPVIVDYDIHSRGDSPVNHLLDLGHVSGIDLVIGLVGIEIPRAGDANGGEPGVGGSIEWRSAERG